MSPVLTRRLLAIHRWTSVIVSLNFIVLALTGLILVFHDEIDDALGVLPKTQQTSGEQISVAKAVGIAREATPDATAIYAFQRPDESPGVVYVGFGEGNERTRTSKIVLVDRHTGAILPKVDIERSFTGVVLQIHSELFLGPLGGFLVGAIGLAIVLAIVTGFIVYGPTMRRFLFGMLRRDRTARTLLADVHKLLGAATFGWNLVVSATGVLLCFSTLLLQLFAATELASMAKAHAEEPVVTDLATIDAAIEGAEAAFPGRSWVTIALPGADLSTRRHYAVLLQGGKGIEEHMFGLAVVDAKTPSVVVPKEWPWYLKAVLVSEPLHFGNYGKLPLKIVWSLFTLVTLALSISGVWVFFLGRSKRKRVVEEAVTARTVPAVEEVTS